MILDVAGGKGHLSVALQRLGLFSVVVDPCAGTGRALGSAGFFHGRSHHDAVEHHHVGTGPALQTSEETHTAHIGAAMFVEYQMGDEREEVVPDCLGGECTAMVGQKKKNQLFCVRRTIEQALAARPGFLDNVAAMVGLHPDEATEAIVDAALAHQIPFAVVPCCVLPQLFPERKLHTTGAKVKKLGSFVEYLRQKDRRIRQTRLDIHGRNTVLFMTV
jgi:hypothetical protein